MPDFGDGRRTMFLSPAAALDELLDREIISEVILCDLCNCQMKIVQDERITKSIKYRCLNTSCRHSLSLVSSNLNLNDLFYLYYCIFVGLSYTEIKRFIRVEDTTILRAKKQLRESYKIYNDRYPFLLGGLNYIVECDETVLSRRGIIVNPTTTEDSVRDTVWILGCIDNSPARNFYITRIATRQVNTLYEALRDKINVFSTLYTDGYPSYPQLAERLGLNHRVVNHSHGFTTEDGIHTNNIEGFWSHLKAKMRSQHGVQRRNIDEWIEEYIFERRFLHNTSFDEFNELFMQIIKIIINN
ncbi:hypothetical protein ENBRE01_2650 [Enteropsectra breve]|nr:hypothetical protein ENBRE01_2650 [Enteropsectra breve]